MPVRRIPYGRRSGRVRRTGFRAAAYGGAGLAYRAARTGYRKFSDAVSSMRRAGGIARYANNFLKNASQGKIGKAVLGISSGGDYTQREVVKITTGKKLKPTVNRLAREIKNASETSVYRWTGVKAFDDNGYYFIGSGADNTVSPTYFTMPCYIFDLTCAPNYINGATVYPIPCKRALWQATAAGDLTSGDITWQDQVGLSATGGSSASTNFLLEKRGTTSVSTDGFAFEKSRLLWTQVGLNLWGAKNKAIKYTVQLVQFTDTNADPWDYPYQDQHTAFWQSELKHLVYNPLVTTGRSHSRKLMKVLKTYTKVIQPTTSTENDVDPHVVTVKMFNRWNKDLTYKNNNQFIGGASSNLYDVDFLSTINGAHCQEYAAPKQKIYLLIRAEVYTRQDTPDNTVTPSFDLMVRACHVPQI